MPTHDSADSPRALELAGITVALVWVVVAVGAEPLRVTAEFEGGSAKILQIDQVGRTVDVMPAGTPDRGWPCWWYLRLDGLVPGERVTLRLHASTATKAAGGKALAAAWSMPDHAAWSADGIRWLQTDAGVRENDCMVYTLEPPGHSAFVAWGPPFTPTLAAELIAGLANRHPCARAVTLCTSREGRPVPMLQVREGDLPDPQRFGIWVQARQHAWESGSSWVARGFAEWCVGDSPEAAWLRQRAEIFVVPIMDVDNTATGNGGKDADPWDHNRDWSDQPRWAETAAAQRRLAGLVAQGRMDVFLDLHNPAAGDPSFFYVLDPQFLPAAAVAFRDRFIATAYRRIAALKPLVPMSNQPKITGPNYHPRWREISGNWVATHGNPHTVSLCLETIWNSRASTTDGYPAVGAALAAATQEYLATRPAQAAAASTSASSSRPGGSASQGGQRPARQPEEAIRP